MPITKNRKGKTLTAHKSEGQKIHIQETFDEHGEGRFIAEHIQFLCSNEGADWEDFAILYRTNAQSRALEDYLRMLRVPYKIVGGVRFYERKEIKEILSYLKLILNSRDDASFLAIINSPRRGLGKSFLSKLQRQALDSQKSLYDCLKTQAESKSIKGKTLLEVNKFIEGIEEVKSQKGQIPLYELYTLLLNKSGYMEYVEREKNMSTESRSANLQEFGNVIEQKERQQADSFMDLELFLEEMSLLTQEDKTEEGKNSVTLMTLHNSKGLEFNTVFISGMEEGLFPSFQSLEDNNLEEERRLAYVGITRAKERLILSYAKKRKFWGRDQYNPPSCFLSEIPIGLVNYEALSFHSSWKS